MNSKIIDLHVHTTISDGSHTPTEVINMAKDIGLSAIAITDHDTIDGIQEAINRGNELGNIEVIPGVEITTDYFGSMHILGYYLNIYDENFGRQLEMVQQRRMERNYKMIQRFNDIGIPMTLKDLTEIAQGTLIGRLHFSELLKKKGIVANRDEAFDKYLAKGKLCYVEREKLHPHEAIKMIRDNGGFAVLAHPVHVKVNTINELREVLLDLKSAGLHGVEVYHCDHSEENFFDYLELAKELNLYITGGSDFHGTFKDNVFLGTGRGNLKIPYHLLEQFKLVEALPN